MVDLNSPVGVVNVVPPVGGGSGLTSWFGGWDLDIIKNTSMEVAVIRTSHTTFGQISQKLLD